MGACYSCLTCKPKGWDTSVWTVSGLRQWTANMMAQGSLPPAWMPGGVVTLFGNGGLFNPSPLLNPAWFEGRMTDQEWGDLIREINGRTMRSYIGTKSHGRWVGGGRAQDSENARFHAQQKARAIAHLRPLLAVIIPWWREQRGIHITFTVQQQQVTMLYFAVLPAPPALAQMPRQTDGTYALPPPPSFTALMSPSAEEQPGQATQEGHTIAVLPRAAAAEGEA